MTVNTIEGLRINQWGVEGVRAVGTATLALQPTAAETFVIGAQTYTWKASGASAQGEINVGADLAAAKLNFKAAINGTDGWNAANPVASAATFVSNNCAITARIPGTAGNSIIFTEAMVGAGNVFDGGGVLGGTTPGSFAPGTAVAATSKMAVEKLDFDDSNEKIQFPMYRTGYLVRHRGQGTAVEHQTGFNMSDGPVNWEQLPQWLSMSFNGQPMVVYVPGSPNVYRMTFTRAPGTNPNLASYTLERRFSDGNGSNVDQRASYCFVDEYTIKYAVNEALKHSAKGIGRKFDTNALTSALSLPTTELGVSALSTVYVDDDWASIGNTLLTEQVVGWELSVKTGLYPQFTAEGRTDLDFTKALIDAANVQISLKMSLLLDPTTYAAEAAKAAAVAPRAVQIHVAGSGGRLLKLNGLFQYAKPSLFGIKDQNGQDIVDVVLEEYTDGTNFLEAIYEHPSVFTLA